jgi:CRISPR-associated protein (TIGR02710 family)
MSAALVSVAIARELGALSYVHGDRDANGRVRSGTERLIPLRPNAIFSRERLKTFCRLFDRYRFDAAISVLEGSSTHPSMESENRVFLQLAKCYSAWDRFDFKTAVDMMASIDLKELSRIERFKPLSAALSQQKQFIFRIDERNRRREYSELDVIDLFSNALRRKEEGRYDDCVSRLYRLVEMVGQIEFQKAFRMSTSRADLAKLPEHVVSAMGFKDRKGVVELPLFKTYSGLSVVKGSSIAKAFHDNRERFREYLLVRNNSRLAHGLKPIGRKVCEEFVELVREVFKVEDEVRFVRLSEMF